MKYEIEIEGLPEGWEPVAYRHPADDEDVLIEGEIRKGRNTNKCYEQLIIKKKQPRRIVLEETETYKTDTNSGYVLLDGKRIDYLLAGQSLAPPHKIWREVSETDLSLTNEDPKLSLTADECREIFHCKTANTIKKIREFIKDK